MRVRSVCGGVGNRRVGVLEFAPGLHTLRFYPCGRKLEGVGNRSTPDLPAYPVKLGRSFFFV